MINPDYKRLLPKTVMYVVDGLGYLLFFWILPKKIDRTNVRSIVIVKFDQIGDTFMATPTIEAIRRHFPDAEITAFAAPWNEGVLVGNPHLTKLVVCNGVPNLQKAPRFSRFAPLKKIKYY